MRHTGGHRLAADPFACTSREFLKILHLVRRSIPRRNATPGTHAPPPSRGFINRLAGSGQNTRRKFNGNKRGKRRGGHGPLRGGGLGCRFARRGRHAGELQANSGATKAHHRRVGEHGHVGLLARGAKGAHARARAHGRVTAAEAHQGWPGQEAADAEAYVPVRAAVRFEAPPRGRRLRERYVRRWPRRRVLEGGARGHRRHRAVRLLLSAWRPVRQDWRGPLTRVENAQRDPHADDVEGAGANRGGEAASARGQGPDRARARRLQGDGRGQGVQREHGLPAGGVAHDSQRRLPGPAQGPASPVVEDPRTLRAHDTHAGERRRQARGPERARRGRGPGGGGGGGARRPGARDGRGRRRGRRGPGGRRDGAGRAGGTSGGGGTAGARGPRRGR